jgi:cytochrome c-type biogenesis protein CcmH
MTSGHRYTLNLLVVLLGLLIMSGMVLAQEQIITQDEVNAVAERMYCPVCENIPLDDCGTPTCVQWKEEIRLLLAEGKTSAQIVDEFVLRYGEQVVGIPQNTALRGLAFIIPLVGIVLAVLIAGMTFARWRNSPYKLKALDDDAPEPDPATDDYRAQLERDLK